MVDSTLTQRCGAVTMLFGYADPCRCVRPEGHSRNHMCDHETPYDEVGNPHGWTREDLDRVESSQVFDLTREVPLD